MLGHQLGEHLEHLTRSRVVAREELFEVIVREEAEHREISLLELDHVRECSEMLTRREALSIARV